MKKYLSIILVCLLSVFVLGTIVNAAEYSEAPELKEQVEAGELPPVAERLPEDPKIVESVESIGQYGGTLRRVKLGNLANPHSFLYNNLVIYNSKLTEIEPHVASDWEINEDATEFTFYLREGMRWSDGEPFTADDIIFWEEAIAKNSELYPTPPGIITVGNKVGDVEKIDDYTVKFTFPEPNAIFLHEMATYWGFTITTAPKHYLEQFHPDYTDEEELKAEAEEEGFDTWADYFDNRWNNTANANPDRPTLRPYKMVVCPPDDPAIMERNPYYWAVDSEGNQLPYIDKVRYPLINDSEVKNMKVLAGELDFSMSNPTDLIAALKKEADKGNYEVRLWYEDFDAAHVVHINMNVEDEVKRDIFQDKRFRYAVSHAINRAEINDLIYYGLAEEHKQPAPPERSDFHNSELAESYLEYDPEKAGQLLDEIGLAEKNDDGYRVLPNGEEFKIAFTVPDQLPDQTTVAELVIDYLNKIGIKANMRVIEYGAWFNAVEANEYEATVWTGNPAVMPLADPRNFLAHASYTSFFAPEWANWFNTNGEEGTEPSAVMKEAWDYYQQAIATPDREEQVEHFNKVLEIAAENLWAIGTTSPLPNLVTVAKDLKNVPADITRTWDSVDATLQLDQWYFETE